jgi:hypothetical protein
MTGKSNPTHPFFSLQEELALRSTANPGQQVSVRASQRVIGRLKTKIAEQNRRLDKKEEEKRALENKYNLEKSTCQKTEERVSQLEQTCEKQQEKIELKASKEIRYLQRKVQNRDWKIIELKKTLSPLQYPNDPMEDILSDRAKDTEDAFAWYGLAQHILTVQSTREELDSGKIEYAKWAMFRALEEGRERITAPLQATAWAFNSAESYTLAEAVFAEVVKYDGNNQNAWKGLAEAVEKGPTGQQQDRKEWVTYCLEKASQR